MKIAPCCASLLLFCCCATFAQTKTPSPLTQLNEQVQTLARAGRLDEAIIAALRAVELQKTAPNKQDFVIALLNFGTLKRLRVERDYKQIGAQKFDSEKRRRLKEIEIEAEEAEMLLRQVIKIHETDLKIETHPLASASSELAWLLQNTRLPFSQKERLARNPEIQQLLERALKIRRSLFGESSALTLKTTADLAEFYLLQCDFEKSLPLFQSYLKNAPKTFGETSRALVPVLQLYAANLVTIGKETEIDEVLKRISAITKKSEEAPPANLTLNKRAINLAPMRHPDAVLDIDSSTISDIFVGEIRAGNWTPKSIKTFALTVKILIDEQGNVAEAKAENENESLRKAAEKAALKSTFKPLIINGEAQKMRGVLKYLYAEVERKR